MAELPASSLALLLTLVGAALCFAEALAPGAHLIVLGVALLVAGLLGLLVPALSGPLALAAVVLVVGALSLYVYRSLDIYGGKGSGRTRDSSSLVGQEGRVVERVTPTGGRVRLREGGFDPTYSARSIDGELPEGTEVIVVDPGGGSVLTVEAVDATDGIDRELAREREREPEPERERDGD